MDSQHKIDKLFPQDIKQLLLDEVFALLHGRKSFSGIQQQEMKEYEGAQHHQPPRGTEGEADQ